MAQGYHDWTPGETVTAATLEDYCQNQTTMRFASAAARDTALSAVLTEGLRAYLVDVNTETIYSGSAWSTVGPVHGALSSWTPTLTQSGAVTKTVTHGVYSRVGRRVNANCLLAVTGTGSASNIVTLSLPVAASCDNTIIGTGYIADASAGVFYTAVVFSTGSGANCFMVGTTNQAVSLANMTLGSGGNTFNAALANTDAVSVCLSYEAVADA